MNDLELRAEVARLESELREARKAAQEAEDRLAQEFGFLPAVLPEAVECAIDAATAALDDEKASHAETLELLSAERTARVEAERDRDRLRAWAKSRAAYYAKDAKELKAEAAKLARSDAEAAMFRSGCADYAVGFAAELRAALAAEPVDAGASGVDALLRAAHRYAAADLAFHGGGETGLGDLLRERETADADLRAAATALNLPPEGRPAPQR